MGVVAVFLSDPMEMISESRHSMDDFRRLGINLDILHLFFVYIFYIFAFYLYIYLSNASTHQSIYLYVYIYILFISVVL